MGHLRIVLNSAFETGTRSAALLAAAWPARLDLHTLVMLDYLVVHTGEFGGPESLHVGTAFKQAALLVRREVVQQGLDLMTLYNVVDREVSPDGLVYMAGEKGALFTRCMRTNYFVRLKECADWLVNYFMHGNDFRDLTIKEVGKIAAQFIVQGTSSKGWQYE